MYSKITGNTLSAPRKANVNKPDNPARVTADHRHGTEPFTADHGGLDIEPETVIHLEEIESLQECLTIPPAGEAGVRDCFVRPGKVVDFERLVGIVLRHVRSY